jgi:hypothetical protein
MSWAFFPEPTLPLGVCGQNHQLDDGFPVPSTPMWTLTRC